MTFRERGSSVPPFRGLRSGTAVPGMSLQTRPRRFGRFLGLLRSVLRSNQERTGSVACSRFSFCQSFRAFCSAGVQGFEPQLPDPESDDDVSTAVYSRRFMRKTALFGVHLVCTYP